MKDMAGALAGSTSRARFSASADRNESRWRADLQSLVRVDPISVFLFAFGTRNISRLGAARQLSSRACEWRQKHNLPQQLTGATEGQIREHVLAIAHDFAAAWRNQPKWIVLRPSNSVVLNATLVEHQIESVRRGL